MLIVNLHELEDFKRQQVRRSKENTDLMKQQEEYFANEILNWNNDRLAFVREIGDNRKIQTKFFMVAKIA